MYRNRRLMLILKLFLRNTFQWLLHIQGLLFDMQVQKTETDEELRNVLTSNMGHSTLQPTEYRVAPTRKHLEVKKIF